MLNFSAVGNVGHRQPALFILRKKRLKVNVEVNGKSKERMSCLQAMSQLSVFFNDSTLLCKMEEKVMLV